MALSTSTRVLKYSRYYVHPSIVPSLQRFNSNPWSASFNAPKRPSSWPLEPKQTETVAVWNQVYRVNDRVQLRGLDNPAQMAHSPWIPTATHCASMAPRIVLSTANRSSTRASRVSRGWSNLEFPIIVFGLRLLILKLLIASRFKGQSSAAMALHHILALISISIPALLAPAPSRPECFVPFNLQSPSRPQDLKLSKPWLILKLQQTLRRSCHRNCDSIIYSNAAMAFKFKCITVYYIPLHLEVSIKHRAPTSIPPITNALNCNVIQFRSSAVPTASRPSRPQILDAAAGSLMCEWRLYSDINFRTRTEFALSAGASARDLARARCAAVDTKADAGNGDGDGDAARRDGTRERRGQGGGTRGEGMGWGEDGHEAADSTRTTKARQRPPHAYGIRAEGGCECAQPAPGTWCRVHATRALCGGVHEGGREGGDGGRWDEGVCDGNGDANAGRQARESAMGTGRESRGNKGRGWGWGDGIGRGGSCGERRLEAHCVPAHTHHTPPGALQKRGAGRRQRATLGYSEWGKGRGERMQGEAHRGRAQRGESTPTMPSFQLSGRRQDDSAGDGSAGFAGGGIDGIRAWDSMRREPLAVGR
ncbi:hypothetical protein B0H16DRAFT_1697968 [Mycena metata]|uniref:Uncharacterized protein n=1 Tax=Mycena metata TaxID=1033252 RepID=A0AAD7HSN1_9AGAR|nr:hypothetical protein B0H16DRAFT_1697968 [Mycena metata]